MSVPARFLRPRRALWSGAVTAVLLALGTVAGQTGDPVPALRSGATILIDVSTLARRYGWSVSAADDAFTARTQRGILTLFGASPDALWQPVGATAPTTVPMSQPPQVSGDAWFAPIDALEVLGVSVTASAVTVPGGAAPLAFPPRAAGGAGFEIVDLGNGVRALRVFQAGPSGPDALSMLIADLALLALAMPEQQGVLDQILTDGPMASDHPLLIAVTSLDPVPWDASLVFEQGALRFEASHPFRFQLVEGGVDRVGPGRPAVGVALVPARFSLEEPLTVRWGDAVADITFRPGR